MEIVELPPGDERLEAVFPVMRELRTELSDDELAERSRAWSQPPPRVESGVLAKYAALVSSASEGAVTRPS
jgi:dihydroxy-acid dehydratase